MQGSELYQHFQKVGQKAGRGSSDAEFAQLLRTAFPIVDPIKLFDLLEQAEQTGQMLELIMPIPIEVGPSDPHDVRLVARKSTIN
jgi:hypothetical protein